MRDLISNIGIRQAILPVVASAAAAGLTVDLLGFNSVAFVINTGAVVGAGDFGIKVQESDDGVTFADAPASAVPGSIALTLAQNATYKLGYIGFKRYTRLNLTKAGGTSLALSAVAIVSDAAQRPVA